MMRGLTQLHPGLWSLVSVSRWGSKCPLRGCHLGLTQPCLVSLTSVSSSGSQPAPLSESELLAVLSRMSCLSSMAQLLAWPAGQSQLM